MLILFSTSANIQILKQEGETNETFLGISESSSAQNIKVSKGTDD